MGTIFRDSKRSRKHSMIYRMWWLLREDKEILLSNNYDGRIRLHGGGFCILGRSNFGEGYHFPFALMWEMNNRNDISGKQITSCRSLYQYQVMFIWNVYHNQCRPEWSTPMTKPSFSGQQKWHPNRNCEWNNVSPGQFLPYTLIGSATSQHYASWWPYVQMPLPRLDGDFALRFGTLT